MPFYIISPFKQWVTTIMEQRESNPISSIYKNPFVVLTSGALVVNAGATILSQNSEERIKRVKEIINNTPADTYRGCIIANNINNLELSYAVGKTPVGIDFTGKVITVDGESGRKVSTPIIQSVDIDTDGPGNALKTIKVNVKCFTLKQLEMFELFFMKPSMNVLVEWGDSTLLKYKSDPNYNQNVKYETIENGVTKLFTPYDSINEALVYKTQDYKTFCDKFADYYAANLEKIQQTTETKERSLGTYDFAAGKVMDYSFTFAEDGTYDISITINQSNQTSLATSRNHTSNVSSVKQKPIGPNKPVEPYQQIKELISADFNIEATELETILNKYPNNRNDWKLDWFNFIKRNDKKQDEVASADAYISLRFILKILMNYSIGKVTSANSWFDHTISTYYDTDTKKEIEYLPVLSDKYIMSSSPNIIFPNGTLPYIKVDPKIGENKIIIDDKTTGPVGLINGYDFHEKQNKITATDAWKTYLLKEDTTNPNKLIGNALNIFVKYDIVARLWNQHNLQTRGDFLNGVLQLINENSYGLFSLGLANTKDELCKLQVCDLKFITDATKPNTKTYRFKPGTIKSIVKNFNFSFEMSSQMAAMMLFNSNKLLRDALDDKSNEIDKVTGKFPLPDKVYKNIDFSTFSNADNYYSINNVELVGLQKVADKAKRDNSTSANLTQTFEKSTTTSSENDLNQVLKDKLIMFKLDANSKTDVAVGLIYQDRALIANQLQKSGDSTKSLLTPINITITIDGFSGLNCGDYFQIDGVPEKYNILGVFHIQNTKHNITSDGWTTTLEATFRIIDKTKSN